MTHITGWLVESKGHTMGPFDSARLAGKYIEDMGTALAGPTSIRAIWEPWRTMATDTRALSSAQ